jgi:hypothetical protein
VEIGQLAFIAVVLATARALRGSSVCHWTISPMLPVHMVGILGAYWTIQRAAMWLFGGG